MRAVAARLREAGVESVAVCLLHSYRFPEHEERARRDPARGAPGVAVSLSSEILREQREYERSATTVVNAYVRPLMGALRRRHPQRARRRRRRGAADDHAVVRRRHDRGRRDASGRCSRSSPGPAAGVVAALGMARRLGYENAIAFDMGGTTAKASLIEGGAVSRGREYEAGGSLSTGSRLMRGAGELLRIPTIDIAEVGAGGGSIAWLDPAGGLQVGPRSAGAAPGPACYGRGGERPDRHRRERLARLHARRRRSPTGRSDLARSSPSRRSSAIAEPLGLTLARGRAGHPRDRERADDPRAAARSRPRRAATRASSR